MAYVPKIVIPPTDGYPLSLNYSGFSILSGTNLLVSASTTATPSGLTIGSTTVNATTKKATFAPTGWVDGTVYHFTTLALTSDSDTLTGYLDVLASSTAYDGVAVFPSQLLPFLDGARAMELLADDGETVSESTAIDGNSRAFALCQAAWTDMLGACTRGDIYRKRELIDLASDPFRGMVLIELIADLFWGKLIKRRRYVQGEPQAEEAGVERARQALDLLERGQRIFNLDGVAITDSSGVLTGATYINELGGPTRLHSGKFGARNSTDGLGRFWGCSTGGRRSFGNPCGRGC